MPYALMSDDKNLAVLAGRFNLLRWRKELRGQDISRNGGANGIAMAKFRGGGNVTLKTFVRLMRNLGELQRQERLLDPSEPYSPTSTTINVPERRVRKGKKAKARNAFRWGNDS